MVAILTAALFSVALVVAILSIAWMLYSDGHKMIAALRLEHRIAAPSPAPHKAFRRTPYTHGAVSRPRPAQALRAA